MCIINEMKFYNLEQRYKSTILFIHGFGKNHNDWNETKTGKQILIEKTLNKICNTILVDIEEDDYGKETLLIAEEIFLGIPEILLKTKITVVCHSYGAFYGLNLCEINPDIFGRLVLIDPTVKNDDYFNKLRLAEEKVSDESSVEFCKFKNFDTLPTGFNIKNSVIIRIHLNVDTSKSPEKVFNKMIHLEKLTKKNTKSRLIVHCNVSHMLHYIIGPTIINSIKEIYKS